MTEAQQTVNGLSFRDYTDRLFVAVRRLIENKLRLLRDTDQPVWSYVWRAWLIGFIPSIVISILVTSVLSILGYEEPIFNWTLTSFLIIGVLIAPWVETVLMGWLLAILKRIVRKTFWVCLASAAVFGLLHAPPFARVLPAAWLFFVMSICFLEWEKKSKSKAITVTALVHMCQNGLVFAILAVFVLLGSESLQANKVSQAPATERKGGPVSLVGKPPAASSSLLALKPVEMSEERKRKTFQRLFPQFGLDEYMLANEDLYPDWKRNLAPNGTWRGFLHVYEDFVRRRSASGSPPEAEYSLWKDFLAERKKASPQERYKAFQVAYPEFGKDEFAFANADLYPDWKGKISPDGTWEEFLPVYRDFVQWWRDKGSPCEPGFKLWKEFLAQRKPG